MKRGGGGGGLPFQELDGLAIGKKGPFVLFFGKFVIACFTHSRRKVGRRGWHCRRMVRHLILNIESKVLLMLLLLKFAGRFVSSEVG